MTLGKPKESIEKMTSKTLLKRNGKRDQTRSHGKMINYAENSDDSEFEDENNEPLEVPKANKSPVKKATKRETHIGDTAQTPKYKARRPHVDDSSDGRNRRQPAKRGRESGTSSDASCRQKGSKKGASGKPMEQEKVDEIDLIISLADLAVQFRGRKDSHKEKSEERIDIDPIQIALEQFEKRAPYCVTKPERLEGKKAASKASFIKK